jgi:rfaE bifunctional protein nucleotidyltransferase chain/domain
MTDRRAPILTVAELEEAVAAERAGGRTIAFANGCFDILHVGHVRYLRDAAGVGDVLVVAVNGDDSVRRLKGDGRPVMPQDERAEIIAAIRGVAYVTVFDEMTPRALLERLRPDFQCKGTDYTADSVPEADLVRSWGGKVVIVGDPKDHSTSEILSKMKPK